MLTHGGQLMHDFLAKFGMTQEKIVASVNDSHLKGERSYIIPAIVDDSVRERLFRINDSIA